MKRNLLAFATVAALFSAPTFATEYEGWVYNGLTGEGSVSESNIGNSGIDISKNSFSSNSNIGYRWGIVGVEVGYSWFGKFDDNTVIGTTHWNAEAKVHGWNVGATFNRNLNDKWSVQGRLGVFGANNSLKFNNNVTFYDLGNSNNTNWYFGGSIDYNWSEHGSIGLGYTYYGVNFDTRAIGPFVSQSVSSNVNLWGLHSEYRF